MDNIATATPPPTRRNFIRLLGAASCSVLLAPRLVNAATTGNQSGQAVNETSTVTKATGQSAMVKRVCPCCN